MTAVSYHHTINDLQGLDFAASGPFGRREWFALLEQSGAKPFVALARNGAAAAALPLSSASGNLQTLTNWYAFTWSPLASPGVHDDLLESLARDLPRQTRHVTLAKLSDATAVQLERAFVNAGWFVVRQPCDTNHVLQIGNRTYADYIAARPGPLRTTLKRKARKVEVEILTRFEESAWASYEAVYAESWKPGEGDPGLLRRFAEAEGAAGRLRLGLARHEGRVVAAQMWTVENGVAYIHKLAHLESAKPLSPGTTLTAALMEHTIDRDRVNLVDFGTGDDPYKRDWMEQIRPRYRLECWRPLDPRNWPAMAKAALRKLVSRSPDG